MPFSEGITHHSRAATTGGFAAIILWSTTVAFARSLSEQVGPITGATAVYGASGLAALASLWRDTKKRRQIRRLPCRYLVGCGSLFLCYMLVLFPALGLAENREQALEVGLLNYLWPSLTLLFSAVLLGRRANWLLLPGTLLAISGVFLVLTQGTRVSWQSFHHNLASNPVAYSLGLAAAVSWALYSTLTRKWAGGSKAGAVELFLPATAIILLLISFFVREPRAWDLRTSAEAIFLGAATYAAYVLWDMAMRTGNHVLVTAGSYLTPLLSTIVSCIYLAIAPGPGLWIGCGMLVVGSALSWLSFSIDGWTAGLKRLEHNTVPLPKEQIK